MTDVVLGYDNVKQYADAVNSPSDYGASIGRYANRIANHSFSVGDVTYELVANDGTNTLHGGPTGWQYQVYDAEQIDDRTLKLTIVSPDGDNGFPGEVTAITTYTLTDDNTLDITWEATTTKETVINQTNHSYFNLNGDFSREGTNMVLYVNADNFTPSDLIYIPTGEIAPVEGTPFDFRTPRALDEIINDTTFDQIKNAGGVDHNFCLNTYDMDTYRGDDTQVAASLYSPETGIFLEVFTNEPGIQVYTGNFQGVGRDANILRKHGVKYPKHVSVCLESQKYPDTPHHPEWPTANLKPDDPCKLIPANGVYAVKVRIGDATELPGMTNIGLRPTFTSPLSGESEGSITIETHILHQDGKFYGQHMSISFVSRLRDEQRFDSPEVLVAQLRHDAAAAEALLTQKTEQS